MKRKPLIILVVVVLLGVFVTAALVRDMERAVEVEVEGLRQRDLRALVSASGWLEPGRQVDLSANTMGKIVALSVSEGERVAEGDTLMVIDPVRYRGEVEQTRATLRAARAELESARSTHAEAERVLARAESLFTRGGISRQELDKARFAFDRAAAKVHSGRASVRRQEVALETAEHDLDQVTVTAEMSGIITRLNVEESENVVTGTMNNPGTVLLTIADLAEMEVRLEVDETDVVNLALGQEAEISVDAFPDTVFMGRVSEIGHAPIRPAGRASETTADFEVVVRLDQTVPGLRPGLSASADIVTATRAGVLSVSIGALVYRDPERERRAAGRRGRRGSALAEPPGGAPADSAAAADSRGDGGDASGGEDAGDGRRRREVYGLFVIEGKRARFRPVEVGITGERHFEILSGVEEGEEVIGGPFNTLRDLESGDRVRPKKKRRRR